MVWYYWSWDYYLINKHIIKGSDLDKELLTVCNTTVFDLSNSGIQSEIVLYHKNCEILIHKVWIKYIEATSSDTGIKLSIGSTGDDDAYFSVTSEVSKDADSSTEYDIGDMTLAKIPKDTPVIIYNAGSKVGTGTAVVSFSYTLNN